MGLSSRSFTYKRRIKVSPNDLRLAKAGKKNVHNPIRQQQGRWELYRP